jgi:hypothetical protein
MPGVAWAGLRTPLTSIQPATKRKQHPLIVVANQQPQNGPKKNTTVAQQRILRSGKHHISLATGPQNGPQRKDHPIVVQLPSNRSRHPNFPKM